MTLPNYYVNYSIYCLTEDKYVTWILPDTSQIPTTCSNNTTHSVNTNNVIINYTIANAELKLKDEPILTGGHYKQDTLQLKCTANSVTSIKKSYPFRISAFNIQLFPTNVHINDEVSLSVGKDTMIGAITSDILIPTTWITQNYVAGNIVSYDNGTHGVRPYTCILNTISNEPPTNVEYWTLGHRITVSPSVTQHSKIGYYINVSDGTNNSYCGRVISVDTDNNYIYIENILNQTYLSSGPTYVYQTVYIIKDYIISAGQPLSIGNETHDSKSIPPDTFVTIDYNNTTNLTKEINGSVSYKY